MNTMQSAPPMSAATGGFLVACLCAAWCRTCDAYRDILLTVRDDLIRRYPGTSLRFVWVDIEDESDLVGDLDIVDFPTLLLARDDRALFFGPVTPHGGTLERLVLNALADPSATPATPAGLPVDVLSLPARLKAHPAL